jgi:hypothetical protein
MKMRAENWTNDVRSCDELNHKSQTDEWYCRQTDEHEYVLLLRVRYLYLVLYASRRHSGDTHRPFFAYVVRMASIDLFYSVFFFLVVFIVFSFPSILIPKKKNKKSEIEH